MSLVISLPEHIAWTYGGGILCWAEKYIKIDKDYNIFISGSFSK